MALKTLIFVPTYNEGGNVERMASALISLPLDSDVLFIDDASPDGTGTILDDLAASNPRLFALHRSGKLGVGSAHADGIAWAYDRGYERLITLDCDFTHSPTDVLRLIETATGFDVATGSRYLQQDSLPGWNPVRKTLTAFGHLLTRDLLKIDVDATGALRVYDLTRIPRQLFEMVKAKGYGFFFESMFLLVRNGFSVVEMPIVLPARTYGTSKMSFRETLRSGSQLLSLWKNQVFRPSQFRLTAPEPELDDSLVDPQGWDSYWDAKAEPSSRAYEIIAAVYRKSIIRRQLERSILSTFPNDAHLLHAGCGSGQVDERLHGRVRITAVDISSSAVRLYRANNPTAFAVRHANILALPFADNSFDGVYNLGVLEHFTREEIGDILRELNRVLKPDGRVVVFWPHARATSVAVLKTAHWLLNDVAGRNTQLHPPELSLLPSRRWVEALLNDSGFALASYSFGPRDLFVQAVVVAQKTERVA
jgi:dolichol-phosphate mannosyltransferase